MGAVLVTQNQLLSTLVAPGEGHAVGVGLLERGPEATADLLGFLVHRLTDSQGLETLRTPSKLEIGIQESYIVVHTLH